MKTPILVVTVVVLAATLVSTGCYQAESNATDGPVADAVETTNGQTGGTDTSKMTTENDGAKKIDADKTGSTGLLVNDKGETNAAVTDAATMAGEFPDLPAVPTLSGDKDHDKKQIIAAITTLKGLFDANKKAHDALVAKKVTKDSEALKKIERKNKACQRLANQLNDLLDEARKQK